MTELKPCPICGGEAMLVSKPGYAHVECKTCTCRVGDNWNDDSDVTISEALAAWNRRSGEDKPMRSHDVDEFYPDDEPLEEDSDD